MEVFGQLLERPAEVVELLGEQGVPATEVCFAVGLSVKRVFVYRRGVLV